MKVNNPYIISMASFFILLFKGLWHNYCGTL